MSEDAIASALVELAAASTALERTAHPELHDLEEAKDKAKKAHVILDASHKLLSLGIYKVADEPLMAPPLFRTDGSPAVMPDPVTVDVEVEPESDGEKQPALGCTAQDVSFNQAARDAAFDEALSCLEQEGLAEGHLALKDWKLAERAWRQAYAQDPEDTIKRLDWRRYGAPGPLSWDVPTYKEMNQ